MRKLLILCLSLFLYFQGASCTSKIHNKEELLAYVNSPQNGLKQIRQMREIEISATFHPWQLLISKNNRGAKNSTPIEKTYGDKYYFVLSFSSHNKELLKQLRFSQYSEMVQVLAFRMKDYVSLIPENGKEIEPLDCFFQQTYGMSNENEVLQVFDRTNLDGTKKLRLSVKEFGLKTGDLIFNFNTNDIKNAPIIQ